MPPSTPMRSHLPVPPMISVAEARRLVMAHLPALGTESLPLLAALGRAIAQTVDSPFDLPPFNNAAVDGYALRAADTVDAHPDRPLRLPVQGTYQAGTGTPPPLVAGTACRIMTGAMLPAGADVVLKVEDTRLEGDEIVLVRPVVAGRGARWAGEEVARGARLLEPGMVLTPARLGLLANVGLAAVTVGRAPQVAILTTGDELVEPGLPLAPGQIYNVNSYAMAAMTRAAGAEPRRMPIVADTLAGTLAILREAAACDVVVSSGGVSMGGFDFVADALRELGTVHFAAVAQQPGKPMTFATVAGTPFFGLPGNPVSAMVAFEIYVRPALLRMQGHARIERPRVRAQLVEPLRTDPSKTVFLRAFLEVVDGGFAARLTGPQGSGMATSMAAATALVVVPQGTGTVAAGETVEAMVLEAAEIWGDAPN